LKLIMTVGSSSCSSGGIHAGEWKRYWIPLSSKVADKASEVQCFLLSLWRGSACLFPVWGEAELMYFAEKTVEQ